MGEIDEYNAPLPTTDSGLMTLTSDQLHAAIDKQLSKPTTADTAKSEELNSISSLFNDVEMLDDQEDNSSSSGSSSSEEEETQKVAENEKEDAASVSASAIVPVQKPTENVIQHHFQQGQQMQMQLPYQLTSSCSFATLTSVSATPIPQIQQQYIPQVTVPMASVNQVAFAMATAASQNQLLRPANLPAVSSLFNGGGSWSISRATSGSQQATIIRVNQDQNSMMQRSTATNAFIPAPARTSALLPKTAAASRESLNTIVTKLRNRKTSPMLSLEGKKDASIYKSQREEILQLDISKEGQGGVPNGHTHESWILEEGLYKIRRLGLHQTAKKDDYPFKCPLCDKKYKNPNGIKYHAKYAHGPKCSFSCPICLREYATKHGLSAHKRTHKIVEEPVQLQPSTRSNKSSKKISTIIIQAGPA